MADAPHAKSSLSLHPSVASIKAGKQQVKVTVDGEDVYVDEGSMVLDATNKAGAYVPTLCNSDALEPFGACRMCMVDVGGRRPAAACHTPVYEGMQVTTSTPVLERVRKNTLELVISDHPLDCLGCPANQRCELQTVAAKLGFREVRYPTTTTREGWQSDDHPFLKIDMQKCIACARCVRVCDETQGSFILSMAGRGFDAHVSAGVDQEFRDADCRSCGACAIECPVAAISDVGDVDYGVAEEVVTTTCAYCAVGCSLDVHVAQDGKDNVVAKIEPNKNGSANRGHACVKGRFAHEYARHPDRLTTPLIRGDDGELHPATWPEALDLVADRLGAIRDEHGADAFAAISSSRCTNEDNFVFQKFTRTVMNTHSIDNCSRVCHSPSAFGLGKALGTGAGTNSFEDVEHTKCIILIGANPTEAHPVFGMRIKQAVMKGAKLISIDPRKTELATLADVHLQLNPGSNVAVVNALQHVVLRDKLVDDEFIQNHTTGFDTLWDEVKDCTPEWAEGISNVPAALIEDAAKMYATSGTSMILWGLGVTEGAHGSNTVFGLINLGLMTGNIGRLGTGTNPIRGQNNVQGASDVGALPNVFSDYRPITDETAQKEHLARWGTLPEPKAGLTIPDMFDAAHDGTLKAMWIIAEDVAQSDPNTEHVVGALRALDFFVVQDIFLSETAKLADVVFPGATFLEKDGTFVNSDRRIQRVRKALEPLPGSMPDGDVVQEVALRMGHDLGFGTPIDASKVMDELAALSPHWNGVSYARLDAPASFLQWPCTSADHPGTAIVHQDGAFLSGKGKFHPVGWQEPGEMPDDDFPFFLTTGRQLFHYNVGTQTRRSKVVELSPAKKERLRIHPKDAKRLHIDNGEIVTVRSRRGVVDVEAEYSRALRPGTVFMTFHFPETRTNILLSSAADEYTQCPEYKVSAVAIEKQ